MSSGYFTKGATSRFLPSSFLYAATIKFLGIWFAGTRGLIKKEWRVIFNDKNVFIKWPSYKSPDLICTWSRSRHGHGLSGYCCIPPCIKVLPWAHKCLCINSFVTHIWIFLIPGLVRVRAKWPVARRGIPTTTHQHKDWVTIQRHMGFAVTKPMAKEIYFEAICKQKLFTGGLVSMCGTRLREFLRRNFRNHWLVHFEGGTWLTCQDS